MTYNYDRNYEDLLRDGITAAKNGNKSLAWSLLHQAARMKPTDAAPWVWLTEAAEDPKEKQEYLEQALAIDPSNFALRRGLDALKGVPSQGSVFSPDDFEPGQGTSEPVVAQARETSLCPRCGGHTKYDIRKKALACPSCGWIHVSEERSAADDEQVMAFVLPTEDGHSWAVSQHRLICRRCGAHSLWIPGQVAAGCPYCGSHQLIESQETEGLIDPQAIAVMQVAEKGASENIAEWLGKGWTAPDDLVVAARRSNLRPAYYPFWTFDGTLEIQWACDTNEGSSDRPQWTSRSGVEFELFDDVLVPGLNSLKSRDLKDLGEYNLKEVVAFKPEYLAGWPALTYDRPLAKATLLAREQIVRRVRRELHSRVLPGQQKRNLRTGGLNWSDMTFKYVLLPVWVGKYRYKGREYQVMVNGQTGKVSGDKPRDRIKMIGLGASLAATLIVLGLVAALVAAWMNWI